MSSRFSSPRRILHPTTNPGARRAHRPPARAVENWKEARGRSRPGRGGPAVVSGVASRRAIQVGWLFLQAHWNRGPRRQADRAGAPRGLFSFSLVEKFKSKRIKYPTAFIILYRWSDWLLSKEKEIRDWHLATPQKESTSTQGRENENIVTSKHRCLHKKDTICPNVLRFTS